MFRLCRNWFVCFHTAMKKQRIINGKEAFMRIAVCDDEIKICEMMSESIKSLFPDLEVSCFLSGRELLKQDQVPDIVLMDIRMPEMDGIETAKLLRSRGWRNILIFVTGEEDRVFQSFDVQPFHFLVKPVEDNKLQEVLGNAICRLTEREYKSLEEKKQIRIKAGNSYICINLPDIIYAEVYDRKTIIHTIRENIEYYGQLLDLQKLAPFDLYRIHRSFLINLRHVERYNKTSVTLTGGNELPIARRGYPDFVKGYLNYCRR